MVNVLADLALESEAATVATMRLARAFDADEPDEAAFRRLALAVLKYWVCKRGAPLAAEALECLGGNGYVEEAPMAQLYRDIQLGTVWEGSGNVIALDVLRALAREPESAERLPGGVRARGRRRPALRRPPAIACASGCWSARSTRPSAEWSARRLVEDMALALQACLLLRHSPAVRVVGLLRRTSGAAGPRVRRPPAGNRRRSDRRARARALGSASHRSIRLDAARSTIGPSVGQSDASVAPTKTSVPRLPATMQASSR